ncbi:MAG: aminopeptidase P family protein [Planctomycetes bacterium]|nr:aminopeptidase P family protein [Planctomycetota bacterium]
MAKQKKQLPSPIFRGRIADCRKEMKKKRIGALLISTPRDGFYLIGFTGEDSAILVTQRDVHVISDGRFDEAINRECPWVTRWLRKGTLDVEIASVCQKLKIKKLAVQPDRVTLESVATWKKQNKGTRIVHAPPILANLRLIKDASELRHIRKAIRVAQEAFIAVRETIRVGQTERELAARLEYEMQRRGSSGAAFPSIVAVGSNGALPHAHPGRRKVTKGSAILFDWGAVTDGYCSDLTRMVFVGSIPRRIRAIYSVVLAAQERAIAAIRPGQRMCDVDSVARDYIAKAGYGKAFNHGLGHGFGLDVHERPSLSWRSKEKLQSGSLVTVEPGIYLPGVGGVRIEDDILVTPKGCRLLSGLSRAIEDAVI